MYIADKYWDNYILNWFNIAIDVEDAIGQRDGEGNRV